MTVNWAQFCSFRPLNANFNTSKVIGVILFTKFASLFLNRQ